jgi:glycosyltransferase involved in cell wall biosynthesis
MHVALVDTTITTPPTGGAQTFLIDFAESLVRRNIRLTVISQPGREAAIENALKRDGADVKLDLWTAAHLPEEKAPLLANWVNSNNVDSYVISISPDVGWLALPLLQPSIPTLSIAHNDVGAFYEPLKHYYPFIDCAVGVSEAIRRKIYEECSMPAERTSSIAYGVHSLNENEVERVIAASSGRPLQIVYVGRMVQEQKRVMEFVPLVSELKRRKVDFELHLIGDGSTRNDLAAELGRRRLDNHVRFYGWLSSDDVKQRLREMDVFVLLSDYEGLPVALLEAMAHALAPVVTIIDSGNQELVRNELNGFALPVGDIQAFAERLQRLSLDRNLLLKMKRESWQTSLSYSVERMTDRYLACFAEATERARARDYRQDLADPFPLMPSCRSKYPLWLRKVKWRGRAILDLRT